MFFFLHLTDKIWDFFSRWDVKICDFFLWSFGKIHTFFSQLMKFMIFFPHNRLKKFTICFRDCLKIFMNSSMTDRQIWFFFCERLTKFMILFCDWLSKFMIFFHDQLKKKKFHHWLAKFSNFFEMSFKICNFFQRLTAEMCDFLTKFTICLHDHLTKFMFFFFHNQLMNFFFFFFCHNWLKKFVNCFIKLID